MTLICPTQEYFTNSMAAAIMIVGGNRSETHDYQQAAVRPYHIWLEKKPASGELEFTANKGLIGSVIFILTISYIQYTED